MKAMLVLGVIALVLVGQGVDAVETTVIERPSEEFTTSSCTATGFEPAQPPAVTYSPQYSWEGTWDVDPKEIPPDPHGAAGPSGVLQVVNLYVQYFSKTGTSTWGPTRIGAFLGTTARRCNAAETTPCDSNYCIADPRAIYDAGSQRFYVAIWENRCVTSTLFMAVSKNNHPQTNGTGDWYFYNWDITHSSGGQSYGVDFSGLAADDQAIYFTGDLWTLPRWGTPIGTEIVILDKGKLNNGTAQTPTKRVTSHRQLQPASVTGPSKPDNTAYFVQGGFGAGDVVRLLAIKDPLGTAAVSGPVNISIPCNGGFVGFEVPQADNASGNPWPTTLNTQSHLTQGNAFWSNGAAWLCVTAGGSSGRAMVYYYKINTNGYPDSGQLPTLGDSGGFDGGANTHYFIPAIGGNSRGDVCLVFSRTIKTNPTQGQPTIMYTVRWAWADAFETPSVLKASPLNYAHRRWGDYATVAVDPANDSFWICAEYARDCCDTRAWSTWWGNIAPQACPYKDLCGSWGAIPSGNWPSGVAPVHLALTYTGKVLMWQGTNRGQSAKFWDPVMLTWTSLAETHNDSSLINAGQTALGDGRILIPGGQWTPTTPPENVTGIAGTKLFDPASPSAFTPRPSMSQARYNPTATGLPDGRVLTMSGWRVANTLADVPEAYTGTWSSLSTATKNDLSLYPFMYLDPSPNGTRVLYVGPGAGAHGVGTALQPVQRIGNLDVASPTWNTNVASDLLRGGAFVVFDKGKVLKTGGRPVSTSTATDEAEIVAVDLSSGAPQATLTSRMFQPRIHHELVVLPDGNVLALAGSKIESLASGQCSNGVYDVEVWSPTTGLWRKLAPMTHRNPTVPRMYHSTAGLLADGVVLVAGGECGSPTNCPGYSTRHCESGDLYCPPYLFKNGDVLIADADRPAISGNPPLSLVYGEALSISRTVGTGASGVSKVAFVRPASSTHSNDMDQRYVPLTFTDGAPLTVSASNMPNTRLAPPGYYMLFLVNNLGRPSKAPFVVLWELTQSSIAHNLVINPGNTFTITVTWKTTAKATEGDVLELTPPGGGGVITVTGTPTDAAGLLHSLVYTGTCTPQQTWSYVVKSKRPKYTSGDAQSVSVSTAKTFKPTACLE